MVNDSESTYFPGRTREGPIIPSKSEAPTSQALLSRRDVLKRGFYAGLMAGGLLSFPGSFGCGRWRKRERPNILLITLDTTRADRLSCYGYGRKTSQNLDRLANESIIFTRMIATSSWTLPSHASLFTGKFPSSHGANYDENGPLRLTQAIPGPKHWGVHRARPLAGNVPTLAEVLKQASYATGAVVGGPWMKRIFGLAKGFDYYDDGNISGLNGRPAPSITSSALRWVETPIKQPFFLFLNYFDPHRPYELHEGFDGACLPKVKGGQEEKFARYDCEILYMDHHIGRLFDRFKELDLYDRTMIIITADHGELLGEHGKVGHGKSLSEPELRIPLLVKYLYHDVSPKRMEGWLQLTDVLPMILERIAISPPEGIQGSPPPKITHPIVAELHENPAIKNGSWRAIYDGEYKFVWNSRGTHLLYNLEKDPEESLNLLAMYPNRAKEMGSVLRKYIASLPKPMSVGPTQQVDSETERALRALGYLD